MKKVILVVEDDSDLRETLDQVLRAAGFEVRAAANGRQALQALSSREASLVLLDLRMPEMDGLEFRRRQLEDPGIASIPVLVISGDSRAREEASLLGFRRFLNKPFREEDLLSLISDCVRPN